MEQETNQVLKKRRRKRLNQNLEAEPHINSPNANEQAVLPPQNSDRSKLPDEIAKATEAKFGIKTNENLVVIYDLMNETFRTVELKMNFENVNKGIRKMRLAIIRKKMNPNEIIVNEERILTIEFKIVQKF